jgi:hypothetical protein
MTTKEVQRIVDIREIHMVVIAMVVGKIPMAAREIPMAIATEAKLQGTTTILMIMTTIVIGISIVEVVKEKEKISMEVVLMAVHMVAVTMILASVTEIIVIHNPKIKHQIVSLTLTWVAHLKTTIMKGSPGLDLDRAAVMRQIQAAMEVNKIL